MATQTRSAEDVWWQFPQDPVTGEYNGLCRRFGCDNTGARWFNIITGRYYCSSCARTINEERRQQGLDALCELHLSR